MANYNFKGEAYSIPYEAPGFVLLRRMVNIPELIANQTKGQPLVDDDGNVLSLPETGFEAADILRVFKVPDGFVTKDVGVRVISDLDNTEDIQVGDGDQAAGYLSTNLANPGLVMMPHTALYGVDNLQARAYDEDDTIDVTFVDGADEGVFEIFVAGYWGSPQTALPA